MNPKETKNIKGIQFVIDNQGEKTAVIIDLKEWGKEWEEFYKILLSHSETDENWLHQSPFKEQLDQALEWNNSHSPELSDLEALEAKKEKHCIVSELRKNVGE